MDSEDQSRRRDVRSTSDAEPLVAELCTLEEAPMTDQPVFNRINDLSEEEERLWQRASEGDGLKGRDEHRLREIQVELDRCYDLLAQRRARRTSGLEPDEAHVRPAEVVERYQQ